jgi:hypothetical protein
MILFFFCWKSGITYASIGHQLTFISLIHKCCLLCCSIVLLMLAIIVLYIFYHESARIDLFMPVTGASCLCSNCRLPLITLVIRTSELLLLHNRSCNLCYIHNNHSNFTIQILTACTNNLIKSQSHNLFFDICILI